MSIRQGFDFPISAMTAIPAIPTILAALCLRPSAIRSESRVFKPTLDSSGLLHSSYIWQHTIVA